MERGVSRTNRPKTYRLSAPFASVGGLRTVRTRESGRWRFVEFHALVPGQWSVERGHDLVETVEQEIHAVLPSSHITTHLEPIEDERAYNDVHL